MKRIIYIIITILLCFSFIVGCNNIAIAKDFNEKAIENDFNNNNLNDYQSDIIYFNNQLFFCSQANYNYKGIYRLTNNEVIKIDENTTRFLKKYVEFYTFAGKLYKCETILDDDVYIDWYQYNKNNKTFDNISSKQTVANLAYQNPKVFNKLPNNNKKLIDLSELVFFGPLYYVTVTSDDRLFVHYYRNMNLSNEITYNELNDYKIDLVPQKYYISGNIIYFLYNNEIYINDISSGSSESVPIAKIKGKSSRVLIYNNGIFYYTIKNKNGKNVLYSYSIVDKKSTCILNRDCYSFNSIYIQDKEIYRIFVGTDNGVYSLEISGNFGDKSQSQYSKTNKFRKISDYKAYNILVFGEKWLYVIDENLNKIRISQDGKKTEKILP